MARRASTARRWTRVGEKGDGVSTWRRAARRRRRVLRRRPARRRGKSVAHQLVTARATAGRDSAETAASLARRGGAPATATPATTSRPKRTGICADCAQFFQAKCGYRGIHTSRPCSCEALPEDGAHRAIPPHDSASQGCRSGDTEDAGRARAEVQRGRGSRGAERCTRRRQEEAQRKKHGAGQAAADVVARHARGGDTIEFNDSSAAHPTVILHRYDVIEGVEARTPMARCSTACTSATPPGAWCRSSRSHRCSRSSSRGRRCCFSATTAPSRPTIWRNSSTPTPSPRPTSSAAAPRGAAPRRGRKQPQPPLAVGAKVRLDGGTTATVVEYNSVDDSTRCGSTTDRAAPALPRTRSGKRCRMPQPPAVEECSICTDSMDDPAQVTLECCRQKIHRLPGGCLHVDPRVPVLPPQLAAPAPPRRRASEPGLRGWCGAGEPGVSCA